MRIPRSPRADFPAQVEKVWVEMGGDAFSASPLAAQRIEHDRHHGARREAR